jgi:cobalt transporter subunit CbtB
VSEVMVSRPAAAAAVHPPAIALREPLPWALLAFALVAVVYAVGAAPDSALHEWLHDGRHLLGFPCH